MSCAPLCLLRHGAHTIMLRKPAACIAATSKVQPIHALAMHHADTRIGGACVHSWGTVDQVKEPAMLNRSGENLLCFWAWPSNHMASMLSGGV